MKNVLTVLIVFFACAGHGQNGVPNNLERIASEMKAFKIDTTAAPDDALTKAIIELRNVRGFNISDVMDYKLAEERAKDKADKKALDQMSAFFKAGIGRKWLDNAVIHIYRKQYTYDEVEQLIAFYKTPAGQKMAGNFPLIVIESAKAAEEIGASYKKRMGK